MNNEEFQQKILTGVVGLASLVAAGYFAFQAGKNSAEVNPEGGKKVAKIPKALSLNQGATPLGKINVVVAGSLNIDRFLNMKRWARPGETVEAESFMMTFGGKGANQAITAGYLNSSGGTTHMLGQVGQDRDGIMMLDVMGQYTRTEGIIKIEDAPTGMAYIMLNEEDRENEIIIVGGANMKYPAANVYFLPVSWVTAIKDAHVVLLQREVPEWVNIAVAACARKAGAMTMLDMGGQDDPLSKELIALCDIISPNEVS